MQCYALLCKLREGYEAVSADESVSGSHEDKNPCVQYIIFDYYSITLTTQFQSCIKPLWKTAKNGYFVTAYPKKPIC